MEFSKYKQAGVDIDAGDRLVQKIKPFALATARASCDGSLGGFGGLFDPKKEGYRDPIFVAGTDSAGTKVRLAISVGKHDTIGIDVVAMCVNDVLAQGGEPMFFLDYVAVGKLDVEQVSQIVAGVAQGCKIAGCTLMGGETAEMPSIYALDDYDVAGFAVGMVEREHLINGQNIAAGDILLGLHSDGIHSNGYSLVRKIVAENQFDLDAPAPFMPDEPLGEVLLTPTRIYVKPLLPLIKQKKIKGLAHITGGGLTHNVPRMLADTLAASIDLKSWKLPPVFQWLAQNGNVGNQEMLEVFNCGIGMVAAVSAEDEAAVIDHLRKAGERVTRIGHVIARPKGVASVLYEGLTKQWAAA